MPCRTRHILCLCTHAWPLKNYQIIYVLVCMLVYRVGMGDMGTFVWINVIVDLERSRESSMLWGCCGVYWFT